jgi:hypothetical protein
VEQQIAASLNPDYSFDVVDPGLYSLQHQYWSTTHGYRPKYLTLDDLSWLDRQNGFFARKFANSPDGAALRQVLMHRWPSP